MEICSTSFYSICKTSALCSHLHLRTSERRRRLSLVFTYFSSCWCTVNPENYTSTVSNRSVSSSCFPPHAFCLQCWESSCTREGEIGHISPDRLSSPRVHNDPDEWARRVVRAFLDTETCQRHCCTCSSPRRHQQPHSHHATWWFTNAAEQRVTPWCELCPGPIGCEINEWDVRQMWNDVSLLRTCELQKQDNTEGSCCRV